MIESNTELKKRLIRQISILIIGILFVPSIIIIMLIYQNINYSGLIKENIGKEIQEVAKSYANDIEEDIKSYSTFINILLNENKLKDMNFKDYEINVEDILIYDDVNKKALSINNLDNNDFDKTNRLEKLKEGANIIVKPSGGKLVLKDIGTKRGISYLVVLGQEYWKDLIGNQNKRKVYILNKDLTPIYSSKSNDTYIIDNNILSTNKFKTFFKKRAWGNQGYYFYDTYGKYGRNLVVSYAPIRNLNDSQIIGSVVVLLETSKLTPDENISITVLFITIIIGCTILIRLIFKFSEIIIIQFAKISQKFKRASKEKEKMRKKLLISEKLASLGRITSGIAHEIGNPLSSILSICQILEKQNLPQERQKDFILRIKKDAMRIDSLIKEFLYFYRNTKDNYTKVDINLTIESAIKEIPKNKKLNKAEIYKDLSINLPDVLGDRKKLEIVFTNIIINSLQASTDNGKIYIKTYKKRNYICISIKDNGIGIDKKDMDKIFDPFYTTKPVGQGFGLGLFICQQIIEGHEGVIKVISSKEQGTEFIIKIPFAEHIGG